MKIFATKFKSKPLLRMNIKRQLSLALIFLRDHRRFMIQSLIVTDATHHEPHAKLNTVFRPPSHRSNLTPK